MISVFTTGFSVGLGLIVAIGSQNAFVLRQGLRGEHVALVCFTCALSDAILISLSIAGFSAIIGGAPWLEPLMRYGGAAFLLVYGLRSLWAAWSSSGSLAAAQSGPASLSATIATCLAFTWLNPHVYLDTVFLIGSISTQFEGRKMIFGLGAAVASFAFFFALGYGAAALRPILSNPRSWRIIDLLIGVTMLAIATKLALGG